MIYIMCLLSIGMVAYLTGCLSLKKMDYVKCLVFGLLGFFGEYVLIGGTLFTLNQFSIKRVLFLMLLMNLAALILIRRKHRFAVEFDGLKKYTIPLLVCLALLPIGGCLNGYYGMGVDQGVYQVKALFLMNDKNNNQLYYDEYEKLETDEERAEYVEDVFSNLGFDRYASDLFGNSEEKKISPTSGYFHGVQTYPAMLALSGLLFGVEHMMVIQIIFLFLLIFLAAFLCDTLNLNKWNKLLVEVIIGFSPIILWVTKSSLTEMFIAVLLMAFLYFLATDGKREIWLSAAMIVVFSFYHITIYTIMPMLVFIYVYLYLATGEKRYLYADIICLAGYLVGFFTMILVNASYTTNNYCQVLTFIPRNALPLVVAGVSLFGMLLHLPLLLWVKKPMKEVFSRISASIIFKILVTVMIFGLFALMYLRKKGDIQHTNIAGYIMTTGMVVIPLIVVLFLYQLFRKKDLWKQNMTFVILFMFFYDVLIYSAILKPEVQFYYYYARYLVPYISVIAFSLALLLREIRVPWIWGITALVGISHVKLDPVMFREQDDTRLQWNTLTEVLDIVDEEYSAVILDENMKFTFMLPIKATTENDVFVCRDNLEELTEKLEGKYSHIYYLTQREVLDEGTADLSLLFQKKDQGSKNENSQIGRITKLPYHFRTYVSNYSVYEVQAAQYDYQMAQMDTFQTSGFGAIEGDFSWIGETEASIVCHLDKQAYTMTVFQGAGIPFGELQRKLQWKILFNGQEVAAYSLSSETNEQPFVIEIPEEYVQKGKNIVKFSGDMWSPSEAGRSDNHLLGMSIRRIVFEENEGKEEKQ